MAINQGMIRVIAITEQAKKSLSDLEKRQLPFAIAKSLTEIADLSVKEVQAKTRREYKLHTDFIPRGISRVPAKKSDVQRLGMGTTIVFTKPIISGWMPVHETGGMREPSTGGEGKDKGKYLTIPASDMLKRSFRTGSGKVRQRWKPSTLLQGYRGRNVSLSGGIVRPTRGGRKGKPFIIKAKGSGTAMIVRRKGTKRYPLELLYLFSRRARYKPSWDFEQTVRQTVDMRFEEVFSRNLREAVRTAR